MNNGKSTLIIIENGQLTQYPLSEKTEWKIGRLTTENVPDIKLHLPTVSRKHGEFYNMDGIWFYMDVNKKNGTVFNHKYIGTGIKGRIKPVMLNDGDILLFGSSQEEGNTNPAMGIFLNKDYGKDWESVSVEGVYRLQFTSGGHTTIVLSPGKRMVVEQGDGIAILSGSRIYTAGDMQVTCR